MNRKSSTDKILREIGTERARQISDEGWSTDHDDLHELGELAVAAGCYALNSVTNCGVYDVPDDWPWDAFYWKPKDPRNDLVRAAALIVAEIERLDREV